MSTPPSQNRRHSLPDEDQAPEDRFILDLTAVAMVAVGVVLSVVLIIFFAAL